MASMSNASLRSNTSWSSIFPQELITISSLYEALVIIFCLIGYGLVALAMVLNRRLRSIFNFFILSMGLADCLIATVIIPVHQGLKLRTLSYHSVAACEFVSNINLIAVTAVALNLCAVSLERFFVIAFPFRYEVFLTTKTAAGIIAGTWSYSLVAGLLPQMGWSGGKTVVRRGSCNRPLSKDYLIFATVLHFCVPAAIMITTNVLIYRIASKQAKRIFKISASAKRPTASHGDTTSSNDSSASVEVFRINYKAAKRVSIIVGAYLTCWLPQMTALLIGMNMGYTLIPPAVFLVTLDLQYTSSAVNPCIFCLLNKEIRLTLIKGLKSKFPIWRNRNTNERMAARGRPSYDEAREFVPRPSQVTTNIELSSGSSCHSKEQNP